MEWALGDAENLGGNGKNYDKIFETLVKQIKVLSSLGMTIRQQETVKHLADLEKEKWQARGKLYIQDLQQAKDYIAKLKAKGKDPKQFRDREPLNLEGDSTALIELARRLDLVQAYAVEENLLEMADELYSELYGKDYFELADIKLQLAECLKKEDQIQEITELKLYEKVVQIQDRKNKMEDRAPQDSAEYIRALLKLGQWQRDRSHFDLARANLTRAIELARKGKAINPEEMPEFYNSYADFLRQVGNETEAARYEQMSRELNPKHSRK